MHTYIYSPAGIPSSILLLLSRSHVPLSRYSASPSGSGEEMAAGPVSMLIFLAVWVCVWVGGDVGGN